MPAGRAAAAAQEFSAGLMGKNQHCAKTVAARLGHKEAVQ